MRRFYTLLLSMASLGTAMAQNTIHIDSILMRIEQNNPQLMALRKSNVATMAEKKSENTLGETYIEYSPFFRKGTKGLATTELIVTQEFDFPTLYAQRRKSASLQQNMLDREYELQRRDVLLEARKLCYDLNFTLQNEALQKERIAAMDSLLSIYEERMQHGDATILEINQVKIDRMVLQTESVKNHGALEKIILELQKMGADLNLTSHMNIVVDDPLLPPSEKHVAEVLQAEAALESAQQDIKLTRQGWLPKFTVGYRRNTDAREAINGPVIGLAMPLFSNGRKVKAAKLRADATAQELENARTEVENRRRTLQSDIANMQSLLSTYDESLMHKTLNDMKRAVTAGQMSIVEYYIEADHVYSMFQTRLETENNLHKTMAELSMY